MCPCQSNCNKIYGFGELCQLMNDKPLQEIDEIIYAVCTLCRDHEKAGFIEGIKVGVILYGEVNTVP